MGGSNKVARLAFVWGLIACGAAVPAAKAQESVTKQAPKVETVVQNQASTTIRSGAPWIPQRFQQAQPDRQLNKAVDLGDNHTIVVSTLALILAGVIVLLLIL